MVELSSICALVPAVLAGLAGCAVEQEPVGDGGADTDTSALDGGDPDTDAIAAWTADDVCSHLQSALDLGFPEPRSLLDTYLWMLGQGTDDCPGSDVNLVDPPVSLEGCVSENGWEYAGVAGYQLTSTDSEDTGSGGRVEISEGLQISDFKIVAPSGETLSAGGPCSYRVTIDHASTQTWEASVSGTWQYTGGTGWMNDGISSTFRVFGSRGAAATELMLSGTIGYVGSYWLDIRALRFHSVSCSGVPIGGTIFVRDDEGTWYDLVFSEECSECATVSVHGGSELGECCADFGVAIDGLVDALEVP